jgi:hypothetical protein
MSLSEQRDQLADQVIACLLGTSHTPLPAVVDIKELQILSVGHGSAETHVLAETVTAYPDRYSPIPMRERIETLEHVEAFIHDYAPPEPYLFDQAEQARKGAASVAAWRMSLGEHHRVVKAFDEYMRGFYHIIARMLMHGSHRPHIGILGHQKLGKSQDHMI